MGSGRAPGLSEKLAFLSHQAFGPDVRAIETHMAWVFLTDRFAYKLKKPVRHDRLDFRTLERRRRVCNDEVRLNRRLAGDVYLGVVPLVVDREGRLTLETDGEPVEWLVKMRRLPEERMLDALLAAGTAGAGDLQEVGRTLGRFYAAAVRYRITGADWRRALQHRIDGNRRALHDAGDRIDRRLVDRIVGDQKAFVRSHRAVLDARAADGRIIDAHGDLRPEHIFVGPVPVIIDCIEFSADLRRCDSAEDVAFLCLELERAGAPGLEAPLLAGIASRHVDEPPVALRSFYKSLHACTPARLHARQARDPASPRAALRDRSQVGAAGGAVPRPGGAACATGRRRRGAGVARLRLINPCSGPLPIVAGWWPGAAHCVEVR